MSLSVIAFIKTLILPPTINLIFIFSGLLLKNKYKITSRILLYSGSITLLLFCFSPFSNFLLKKLEKYPALELPVVVNNEQAIVVLSAGIQPIRKEYGREIDGVRTLQRNLYAAFLYKQVKLPVLVTGGLFKPRELSEAAAMAITLMESFNVDVTWQEQKSKNTAENAIYSAAILKENGIDSIYLVTHAWHMPRAVMMFEQEGINVTPAPTMFNADVINPDWKYYFPSLSALSKTKIAMHEFIGMFWYKYRY
jgi:uncharacterized SAM-binding protein YcdF (DUF218 family)